MGGGLASLPGGGGGGCRGEGARGAPLILKLKAENLSNRVGERPATATWKSGPALPRSRDRTFRSVR
jgi:hypothetical protein